MRAYGQDLVDAHAVLRERQCAPGQVQSPDTRGSLAGEINDLRPAVLDVAGPRERRTYVVLAHALHTAYLEASAAYSAAGLVDRAHVHVRCDVGLDERPTARLSVARHLLQEQPPTGAKAVV